MWRADLIWHISTRQDEAQIFFFLFFFKRLFPHNSFLSVPLLTWNGLCWNCPSWFHCITGLLSSHHKPKPVSLPFFPPWPCNLFLFLSSMVPTPKSGAQRKKLMNLSFPLKPGSWASSLCTLSGPAAVSEFHTVTTGQFCPNGGQHVSYFSSVASYLLAHLLQITSVCKSTI